MQIHWVVASVLLFCGIAEVTAQEPASLQEQLAQPAKEEIALRRELVARRVPLADLRGMTVTGALQRLASSIDANLYINDEALRFAGVDLEKNLTVHLRYVPVGLAMELALTDAAGRSDTAGVVVQGNVITVTSADEAMAVRERRRGVSKQLLAFAETQRSVAEKRITDLEIDNVPFGDVVAMLRLQTGATINVKWPELEHEGVDATSTVSLRVADAPFERVLTEILNQLGGGFADLDFTYNENGVTISSADALSEYTVTERLDLRSLIASNHQSHRVEQFDGEFAEEIVDLISNTLYRDSWEMNGGTIGSMKVIGEQLVVTHRPKTIVEIYELLNKIDPLAY